VWLILGLGNPGPEYAGTRHNVGFDVVERLADKLGCSLRNKSRFAARVGDATLPDGKVTLALPQTFMNRTGVAVASLVNWLKLAPVDVLVVVDDADLPLGQLRLRLAGGSGGHNGLRSIIEALGGDEHFARLRVGIGRTGPVGADITDHVLGKFAPAERAAADEAIQQAVAAVECCVKEGLTTAMNQFNRKKGESL
jgi:PTH1 family peptidyl-tRNA hydrolase